MSVMSGVCEMAACSPPAPTPGTRARAAAAGGATYPPDVIAARAGGSVWLGRVIEVKEALALHEGHGVRAEEVFATEERHGVIVVDEIRRQVEIWPPQLILAIWLYLDDTGAGSGSAITQVSNEAPPAPVDPSGVLMRTADGTPSLSATESGSKVLLHPAVYNSTDSDCGRRSVQSKPDDR